jgi:dTDP-4-dehydrorhamnose reductase
MKYLIFGNGYLGNKFNDALEDCVIDPARIDKEDQVKTAIEKHKPDVVINCAARTGTPNIDWCEDHKLETLDSNLRGPLTLLKVCEQMDQYWVQIGSGCIYQGDNGGKGWSEDDAPNFTGSYYSRVKAWMNDILKDFPVLQLRLRMPLDSEPGPRNFITKITNYEKVISVPNSITIIDDLIEAGKQLMEKRATGIYNIVNPGVVEHKDILKLYKEIVDPSYEANYISLEELETMTKAPRSNCILSTKKIESEGINIPSIEDRLPQVLEAYKSKMNV